MKRAPDLRPALALLALAALAYWPVVHCGFVWDDDDYVTDNPVLRSLGGIGRIWLEPKSLPQYYPLVHTTFWLEYRLWGDHPLGYHLVNVALHLGSGLALLGLLRRLAVPGALLAAALFVAHPVQVESVAWVTERKNALSLLCMLLAARQWLRWREAGPARAWWFATAWFVAALLSKTVVATLPAALLVVQWWRTGVVARRDVRSLLPWFAVGIGFGLLTAWLEATHVRAGGAEWQLQGAERFLVAGRAPWFYLGTLLWPAGLCFSYPRWQLDPGALVQWLPLAAVLAALGLALAMRRRLGRAPAAALLLYGGMLMPALGFFDVYPFRFSYVADHFQYHASVAALSAAAAAGAVFGRRLPRAAALGLAATVPALLAVQASRLVHDYRDEETSWRAVLAQNPDSLLALTNLGGLLLGRGDLAEARQCFERCVRRHPRSYEAIGNLGNLAHRGGDLATARSRYEASLAIRPDNAAVLSNFAQLELQEGDPASALARARRAVELEPDMYDARQALAKAAAAAHEWRECVDQADWILKRTPEAVDVRLLAAEALLRVGDTERSLQNAGFLLGQHPGLRPAQVVMAEAFARLLRGLPPAAVRARIVAVCRSGDLDPAPLLPLVADAFAKLGAQAHADALRR